MREKLIEGHIQQLSMSLGGACPVVPGDDLRAMHQRKDFVGMAQYVRHTLRLDMRLRIGFVNKGGLPETLAWINTPYPMPFYGTTGFKRARVTMYLRKSFLAEAPFETVVLAMSHELCHVVLKAINHPLKASEEAVDLTAMLLGFRNFYRAGCEYDIVLPRTAGESLLKKAAPAVRDWWFGKREATACALHTVRVGDLTRAEVNFAAILMGGQLPRRK